MSSSCSPRDKKMLDVLVIGGGNAALCAAITARRAGATVKLIEASPKDVRGGNSRHTRNIRYIHPSKNSFLTGPYEEEECYKDLLGVTKGNTIESMARLVIRGSNNVGDWMMEQGVHFQPAMRGTLHLSRTNGFFLGGGKALINAYYATAEKRHLQVGACAPQRRGRTHRGKGRCPCLGRLPGKHRMAQALLGPPGGKFPHSRNTLRSRPDAQGHDGTRRKDPGRPHPGALRCH